MPINITQSANYCRAHSRFKLPALLCIPCERIYLLVDSVQRNASVYVADSRTNCENMSTSCHGWQKVSAISPITTHRHFIHSPHDENHSLMQSAEENFQQRPISAKNPRIFVKCELSKNVLMTQPEQQSTQTSSSKGMTSNYNSLSDPAVNKRLRSGIFTSPTANDLCATEKRPLMHKSELELAVAIRQCKVFITC